MRHCYLVTRVTQLLAVAFIIVASSDARSQNRPPEWGNASNVVAIVGQDYECYLTASDPDGDKVTVTPFNLPTWLQWESATYEGLDAARIYGRAESKHVGQFKLGASAADPKGGWISGQVTINVTAASNRSPSQPVTLAPSSMTDVSVDAPLAFNWMAAMDPDNDAVMYALTLKGVYIDTILIGLTDTFVVVPGHVFSPNDMIEWYVTAYDGEGGGSSSEHSYFQTSSAAHVATSYHRTAVTWLNATTFRVSSQDAIPTEVQIIDVLGRVVANERPLVAEGGWELILPTLPGGFYTAIAGNRSIPFVR